MSKNNKKNYTLFKDWQCANPNRIETRYIRMGNSLMLHPAMKSLNHLSFRVYASMLLESGGNQVFTFPHSKYAGWCSNDGFQKAVAELCEKGFIEVIQRNKNLREPNVYRFSEKWKDYHGDPG